MGTGPSRTIEWGSLEEHPYIRRIIDAKVTGADPLWNQLLSFRVPLQPKLQPEHEKSVESLCRQFLQVFKLFRIFLKISFNVERPRKWQSNCAN